MTDDTPPVIDEEYVKDQLVEAVNSGREVTININDLSDLGYSMTIGPEGVVIYSECCSAKVSLVEAININAALTAWLAQ